MVNEGGIIPISEPEEERVAGIFRRHLDGLPDEIYRHSGGRNHENYRVKMGHEKYLLRCERSVRRPDLFFHGLRSMGREIYAFELLRDNTDIPVPEQVHYHPDQAGKSYAILSNIDGRPYGALKGSMGMEGRKGVVYQLGRWMAQAHAMPMQAYGDIVPLTVINRAHDMKARMNHAICEKLGLPAVTKRMGPEDITKVYRSINEWDFPSDDPVFVMYDIHPGNFMVEGAQISGFFDIEFPQAAIADLDFDHTELTVLSDPGGRPALRESFISGYVSGGGHYDEDATNKRMRHYMLNHFLMGIAAYDDKDADPVRARWSDEFVQATQILLQEGNADLDMIEGEIGRPLCTPPEEPIDIGSKEK